jgi:hypothetical protein
MDLKNCELKNNIIFNKAYLDKSDLIAGVYSKQNLESVVTVSPSSEKQEPFTNTTVNIAKTPFYIYYNIDPNGSLFGNTPCGLKNYTNYMQINMPTIASTASLKSCIPECKSLISQFCPSICSPPNVIDDVEDPYQLGSRWSHLGVLYDGNLISSPPIISNETMYVTSNVENPYQLGSHLSHLGLLYNSSIISSPSINSNETMYVTSNVENPYQLGSRWSSLGVSYNSNIISLPALDSNETIYVTSNDGYLYAFN